MSKACLCMIALMLGFFHLQAQEWKSLNADDLFTLARQTAFDGNREEARKMLAEILNQNPAYDEVRIFLARTYGWDAQYDLARGEIKKVLATKSTSQQALEVLVDLDIWSMRFNEGLANVDHALSFYPNSQEFLIQKATILKELNRPEEAATQIARLLELNPSHGKAMALMKLLKSDLLRFFAGFIAGADHFNKVFSNAYNGSLQLGHRGHWGTGMVRLNYASRFDKQGWQPELEIYPRLSKKTYGYLNYGYSTSLLFPKQRLGAEIFSVVMKNFEVSAGLRYMFFNDTVRTTLYTGSLGYYAKKYWISFRPFFSTSNAGNTFSNTLNVRRYFKTSDDYVGLQGGLGFTPDERRFQSAGGLSQDGIYVLRMQRMGIAWQKNMRANFMINLSLNFTRQEQSFGAGNYLWITSGTVWVRKRF